MTSSRCHAAQSRAQQLRALGAEVVAADNHDIDSLEAALEGAHGVYAITTWSGSSFAADGTVVRSDNLDPVHLEESEVAQGINILRAAGVSALSSTTLCLPPAPLAASTRDRVLAP
jgi:uncharacterized protein YbjT (DUF2867 family)